MTLLLAAHAQTFGANNGLQIGQRGIEVIIHDQVIIFGNGSFLQQLAPYALQ